MMSGVPERKRDSLLRRLTSPLKEVLSGLRTAEANEDIAVMSVAELAPPPPRTVPNRSLADGGRVEALQRDLGMRFADPNVLREALTHRSYLNEINQAWPSNERLEFLGDAVLGLLTTDYLFRRFPELGEGELTNLRSALVRTETLARFAQEIDLGRYLFLGRGEEMSQGRRRPAGLACAFEALLGSIYMDAGYPAARDFAMRFVEPELTTVVEGRLHRNAKSVLQELVQAQMQQTPSYHLVEETGPDHAKAFTIEVRIGDEVLGRGHDRSKRGAEQSAAEIALRHLTQPQSQEIEASV
jgi:ribonuclease-3